MQPNGDLVYSTAKNLRGADHTRLLAFCQRGGVTVTVPAARRNDFFAALRERNVINEKHAAELPAREVREQERARLDREERARRAAAQGAGQEPANNPPPPAN